MPARVLNDLTYADRDGHALRLDLHLPETSSDGERLLPVVIHFHGGGWRGGERRTFPPNDDLVRAGFAVADVEYRLTGEAKWPAQMEDASEAANWVARHAREYGLDPLRIGAWGLSAGGHLTAILAIQRAVNAVVLLAPPVDIRDPSGWNDEGRECVEALLGPEEASVPWREFASPITHNLRGTPPTLIVHGDADDLVPIDGTLRYFEKLRASGVSATLVRLSDVGHDPGVGFLGWDGIAEMAVRFFRRHLV